MTMSSVPTAAPAELREELAGRLYLSVARLIRRMRVGDQTTLGPGALSALATIVAEGPLRLGDLAAVEGVRAPTMSRIVDALVNEAYAERIPDPADGRACLVRSTDAGGDVVSGTRTARSYRLIERMSVLDDAQLAALAAALPVLEAIVADEPLRPAGSEA
jgi:DNA-binding MarR family transcriptional regulator